MIESVQVVVQKKRHIIQDAKKIKDAISSLDREIVNAEAGLFFFNKFPIEKSNAFAHVN